jgi:hypothetical protein
VNHRGIRRVPTLAEANAATPDEERVDASWESVRAYIGAMLERCPPALLNLTGAPPGSSHQPAAGSALDPGPVPLAVFIDLERETDAADNTSILHKMMFDAVNMTLRGAAGRNLRGRRTLSKLTEVCVDAFARWRELSEAGDMEQLLLDAIEEQEPHWIDYDRDEGLVKDELANMIWEDLLEDTVRALDAAQVARAAFANGGGGR